MKKGIWTLYPVKICPKYYVKGTTLRLLRNMHLEDLTAKTHNGWSDCNGWVGCDTRNQAKRLIAKNREIIKIQKIQKIINCAEECFIQAVNSLKVINFKTSNDDKEEK